MKLRALLCDMFERMVVPKDPTLIDRYYHPDFVLYTNGQVQDMAEFRPGHERIMATPITYKVEYDDDAWVESGDRLAGRVFITTQMPDEPPRRIEVILIAIYLDGLLHKLWELTWPDWSQLPGFEVYSEQ